MLSLKRNTLVAGFAFAFVWLTCQHAGAQTDVFGIAALPTAKIPGLPGSVKQLIDKAVVVPNTAESASLVNVAVQSWFSTEPVILPPSNFVFQGISAFGEPCPKSNPVSDGTAHGMKDSLCIYGATFSQRGYYSSTIPNPLKPTSLAPLAAAGMGQVLVDWPGIPGTKIYHLYSSTTKGVIGPEIYNGTSTHYTQPGLANGVTYYYSVSSEDGRGVKSPLSDSQASAMPFWPTQCPKGAKGVADEQHYELNVNQSAVPLTYILPCRSPEKVVLYLLRPFIQPNATSVTFSDQIGINATPRWSLAINASPTWIPWLDAQEKWHKADPEKRNLVSYFSFDASVNLNNQINSNPNSSIGSIQWNLRSRNPFSRQWFRPPGLDVTMTGVEYDFVSNDVNIFYPSASVKFPIVALDHNATPGVFVWKLNLGEIAGYHERDPSAGQLSGQGSVSADIKDEGSRLFRGAASTSLAVNGWGSSGWNSWLSDFSVSSTYQVLVPATDEPFTIASTSSSKPPTITLTDKARHFVTTQIAQKLGNSNFSVTVKYQYGTLPPAFWLVKNSLQVGITLSSGSGRAE
jgi:hypothetical protein